GGGLLRRGGGGVLGGGGEVALGGDGLPRDGLAITGGPVLRANGRAVLTGRDACDDGGLRRGGDGDALDEATLASDQRPNVSCCEGRAAARPGGELTARIVDR